MKRLILLFCLAAFMTSGYAQNTFVFKTKRSEVILLSEGQFSNKKDVLIGLEKEMLDKSDTTALFKTALNIFLVKTRNGKNILVDTGLGRELFNNLAWAGVSPDMIDIVLITHLHGDHYRGLVKENKKTFPNAKIYISKEEYPSADENAKRALKHYDNDLVLFEPGVDKPEIVCEKIKAWYITGHTPGHTVYQVDNLLIWGDVTHAMDYQMTFPQVAIVYDTNAKKAVENRKKLFDYIVKNNLTAAGMHIPYPAFGKVSVLSDGSYKFTPVKH